MTNHCLRCLRRTSLIMTTPVHTVQTFIKPVVKISSIISILKRDFNTSQQLNRTVRLRTIDQTGINLQQLKQRKYTDDYIEQKIEEYDLGVRRLAVMMGENPDTFTETDVRRSIRYLFPSDITIRAALPQMEHPSKVFPPAMKVEADKEGRPFHHLFYTKFPNMYALMTKAYKHILDVQALADKNLKLGHDPPEPVDLRETRWMSLSQLLKEVPDRSELRERDYEEFIAQMERLVEEPYASTCKEFIMKYRVEIHKQSQSVYNFQTPEVGDDGREYVVANAARKTAKAEVKLIAGGAGKITINGVPMQEFFHMIADRETLIAPFTFLNLQMRFDVEATVDGGFQGNWTMLHGTRTHYQGVNKSAMAGAVRLAISRGIRAFIDPQQIELLRRAGLLTRDPRMRERKKPGRRGAREKPTWKKR